jgi:hypothetical protein
MPNLADLSTATKVLLGAGVLMFIDLFLSWQKQCADTPIGDICGKQSGWHGWGVLIGLLVIALIVWEGITLAGMASNLNVPIAASVLSAGLAAAILLVTIIKFLVDNEARSWPAWVGLILAIAIAVGGWLKYQETPQATTAPEAPPPTPPPAPPA